MKELQATNSPEDLFDLQWECVDKIMSLIMLPVTEGFYWAEEEEKGVLSWKKMHHKLYVYLLSLSALSFLSLSLFDVL